MNPKARVQQKTTWKINGPCLHTNVLFLSDLKQDIQTSQLEAALMKHQSRFERTMKVGVVTGEPWGSFKLMDIYGLF